MTDLIVSEAFGPTFQGEGPSTGRQAVFLRLGLCNLSCRWCDTPYTWDWSGKNGPPQDKGQLLHLTPTVVAEQLAALADGRSAMLVVTGGEPMLQQSALSALVELLPLGQRVEVETNGTILPRPLLEARVDGWNVSPKLAHAQAGDHPIHPEVLRHFDRTGRAAFKFVVGAYADLDEVAAIVEEARLRPSNIWIMPEGRTAARIAVRTAELADAVVERGWNLSTRLHVLAWGDERGR